MCIDLGGRLRTISPPPQECIELGKELVQWATEETKEWRCLLQQWYSLKKKITRREWKLLIKTPEFSPYYEQAQAALATKAVNGTMDNGFGHRYIRLYDRDLVEAENEQKQFEASLKEPQQSTHQKVIFEVNYKNDANDKIEISPPQLSITDTPSAE